MKTYRLGYVYFASPAGRLARKQNSEAMRKRAQDGEYFTAAACKVMSDAAKMQWAERRARGKNNHYSVVGPVFKARTAAG
jgi:hypothetical protein